MPYDHNGDRVYAEDVLDAEELAEYRRQRRQVHGRRRPVPELSVEQAEREYERGLSEPWGQS